MKKNNISTFLDTNYQLSNTKRTTRLKSCKHGYAFIICFTIVISKIPSKNNFYLSTSLPFKTVLFQFVWAILASIAFSSLHGLSNTSKVLCKCIDIKAHINDCINKYYNFTNSSKCLNISNIMYQNGPIFSCGLLTINMFHAFLIWFSEAIVTQTTAIATPCPKIAPQIRLSPISRFWKIVIGNTMKRILGSKYVPIAETAAATLP